MIVRPQAGLALVLAAVGDRRCVGCVDRRTRVGFEADRDAVADARRLLVERAHDPELRPTALAAIAEAAVTGTLVQHKAKRLGCGVVERLGPGDVVAADRYVTEHGASFRTPPEHRPKQAGATPAGRTGRPSSAARYAFRSR